MVGSWEHSPQKRKKCSAPMMQVELRKKRVWPEGRMGSGGTKEPRHLEVVIGSICVVLTTAQHCPKCSANVNSFNPHHNTPRSIVSPS